MKMQKKFKAVPRLDEEQSIEIITKFVKNKIKESGAEGLVIGLSGGLDSTTTAYLCARSAKSEKILGLIMPTETTSPEDVEDAVSVARELGIKYEILNIEKLTKTFSGICPHFNNDKLANANLKARLRMILLYYHSNSMNRLVVGTGNRTELLVGYFTKYGDGGVDILPLGDLYKSDVKSIASYLKVPENILKKVPTAGLWSGQTDEDELGIIYELLDLILYQLIDEGLSEQKVAWNLKISLDEVLRIKKMINVSQHKLLTPSIARIR